MLRSLRYGKVATPDYLIGTLLELNTDADQEFSSPLSSPPTQDRFGLDEVFAELAIKFGFQNDSVKNQLENLTSMISSRLGKYDTAKEAIQSLHKDLVSGPQSNYQIWLATTELTQEYQTIQQDQDQSAKLVRDVALFLLIWGEAANVRFMPECLCFIFHLALMKLFAPETSSTESSAGFLDHAIAPLYEFVQSQNFKECGQKWVRRNRDHAQLIGYDDCNEQFWSRERLLSLKREDGSSLFELDTADRYDALNDVQWSDWFTKTYKEHRTALHLLVTYLPIIQLNCAMFYYLTAIKISSAELAGNTGMFVSTVALGGCIAPLFALFAALVEVMFLPWRSPLLNGWFRSLVFATGLILLNVAPFATLISFPLLLPQIRLAIALIHLLISLGTGLVMMKYPRLRKLAPQPFISNFPTMMRSDRFKSCLFWICIFGAKYVMSYFYLIQTFAYPFSALVLNPAQCPLGNSSWPCAVFSMLAGALLITLNLILFHLDLYTFYIIGLSAYGAWNGLMNGISALPWRDAFGKLEERIGQKLLLQDPPSSSDINASVTPAPPKMVRVWNNIIISLFRDHLIGVTSARSLLYYPEDNVKPSIFSCSTVDDLRSNAGVRGEAARRLCYFSRSLAMNLPQSLSADELPNFTVLVPHYAEKLILSLKDIIHEYQDESSSRLSLLDYLKSLYPEDWNSFIEDTRLFRKSKGKEDVNPLSLDAIGFSSRDPEEIMRLRLWTSLRSQTVYRTISGFMNYEVALKSLGGQDATSKFRLVISMQRYAGMSDDERRDVEFILETFPSLHIAYVEREENDHYACLMNLHGLQYKIRLPGPPILGDGKSDNQNLSIIFARGEMIQLIDSNQDNYLEEALKIGCVLREFDTDDVAIVGARENIFSQGIGPLADVAAAKEYTFGTIAQRVLSLLGGRLHYGHPDFVRTQFMITRGGVSKGQKGLHLNEDIYLGMNCFMRSGRIKHTEYIQCGKGRDLGFASILGFVSKIGSGMGEQILSREHYYLGLFLPFDRLLTFYFGHAGFHVNNFLSMFSILLFSLLLFLVSVQSLVTVPCNPRSIYDSTSKPAPPGCFDLPGIYGWFSGAVIAILLVAMVSYIPFVVQSVTEFGVAHSLRRFGKQLASAMPLFEMFTTQMYAYSLATIGLSLGGTGYVATGRGFATYHNRFHRLFSLFAHGSIYYGFEIFILLVTTASTGMAPVHVAFFCVVCFALCLAPFIFNPHQFSPGEFFSDYARFWFWMFRIDATRDSWIQWHQSRRVLFTGNSSDSGSARKVTRTSRLILILQEMLVPLVFATIPAFAYAYRKVVQYPKIGVIPALMLVVGLSLVPFAVNFAVSLGVFVLGLVFGNIVFVSKYLSYTWAVTVGSCVRFFSILFYVSMLMACWMLEQWSFVNVLVLWTAVFSIQRTFARLIYIIFLGNEHLPKACNYAFFSGRWLEAVGWKAHLMWLPLREVFCKCVEGLSFPADFIQAHLLLFVLFPLTLVPRADQWHARMLLWDFPNGKPVHLLQPALSTSQVRERRRDMLVFSVVFASCFGVFLALLIAPQIIPLPAPFTYASIAKMLN